MTDLPSVKSAASTLASALSEGGLWAVVNNAGVCVASPLECVDLERFRKQLQVNLVGHVATAQAFLPLLRKAKGRIVNISSGMGKLAVPYLGPFRRRREGGPKASGRRDLLGSAVYVSPTPRISTIA